MSAPLGPGEATRQADARLTAAAVAIALGAAGIEVAWAGFGTGAGWLLVHIPAVLLAVAAGGVWPAGAAVGIGCAPFLASFLASVPGGVSIGAAQGAALVARCLVLVLVAGLGLGWRRSAAAARHAVERDALTGVLNNPGFRRRIDEERSRLDRGGEPFTLIVIDLDDFKSFNDARGHVAGDECLQLVARVLDDTTRGHDLVARIGGDEFAILLPGTDADGAAAVLPRLRSALVAALGQRHGSLACSLGAATFETCPESAETALAAADRRMYEEKRRASAVR